MSKRLLLLLLSFLLISVLITVNASEEGYIACLQFANQDWSVQEWGSAVSVQINGPGTYSLCLEGCAEGVSVLSVYLPDGAPMMEAKKLRVTQVAVIADGKEIPVRLSGVRCGDLEGNGDYWIELYHSGKEDADTYGIVPDSVCFSQKLIIRFTLSQADPSEPFTDPTQSSAAIDSTQSSPTQYQETVIKENGRHAWVYPVVIGAGLAAVACVIFVIMLKKKT